MNLDVEFPAEIEQALQHQAAAAGMDLSTYVRELVTETLADQTAEKVGKSVEPNQTNRTRNFADRLQDLIDMHPRSGHVDDSRESIYAGRGE